MLMAVMLLIGILQMGAVTSIMPFMAVVADPEIVDRNPQIAWLYEWGNFDRESFLILLGCIVLGAIIVSNAASALGVWLSSRFVWDVNAGLSCDLLTKYLNRPYLWFTQHGSAEAGKKILSDVDTFVQYLIQPLVEFIARGTTVVFLVVLIVIVDWKIALVASLVFGGSYGLIYVFQRRRLADMGRKRVAAQHLRFKSVQEAFGAFKETKVFQREGFFVDAYEQPTRRFSHYMVISRLIKGLPRYLLELLAFGGLVVLVLYFISTTDDFRRFIPILSLYAFAGYRLMPSLQYCFASLAYVRFNRSLLADLHRDFYSNENKLPEDTPIEHSSRLPGTDKKMHLHREIRFDDVTFIYPGGERPAVHNVSLTIPFRSMIAFCGSTGSGKTTMVDLILGLYSPKGGQILVDDVPLVGKNLGYWRGNVGYVPQQIFLCDSTIASNIAFGLPDSVIDKAAVIRAAKAAQIHEFILNELPDGYETKVGERGVRLSGGQRQRMGIARALYHDPDVLIFDEATSALDEMTEIRVMEAIRAAAQVKTVILIAHRLSTVRDCDRIYVVEKGHVVEQGPYCDLVDSKGRFSALVNAR